MFSKPRYRQFMLGSAVALALSAALGFSSIIEAQQATVKPALRPMQIHQLPTLGLEIWTEREPQWITELVSYRYRDVFTVQSPLLSYPPVAMTFTSFSRMQLAQDELSPLAEQVFQHGVKNYSGTATEAGQLTIVAATHGPLQGFETQFRGIADGESVDVRMFLGKAEDKPPVLLQAYTLAGHIDSISEHIRRSWSNVSYLAQSFSSSMQKPKVK